MVGSFAVSVTLLVLARSGVHFSTHVALVSTVIITTICWVSRPSSAPRPTGAPSSPSTTRCGRSARLGGDPPRGGLPANDATATTGENIPMALLGWVAGCTAIWSSLFTVGNFLYGRTGIALALLGVFIVSGLALLYVINHLWSDKGLATN